MVWLLSTLALKKLGDIWMVCWQATTLNRPQLTCPGFTAVRAQQQFFRQVWGEPGMLGSILTSDATANFDSVLHRVTRTAILV